MEEAAKGRAAGVRIGVGSVPVKDRFRQKGRAKRLNECGSAPKKAAVSASTLRAFATISWKSSALLLLGGYSMASFPPSLQPMPIR
jgi:hypothetical protein